MKLPLDLLSAIPRSEGGTGPEAGAAGAGPTTTVQMRGADPTLGGLLGGGR